MKILIALILVVSASAHAQSKPAVKPVAKPSPAVSPIRAYTEAARKDLEQVERDLKSLREEGMFDLCKFEQLNIEKQYAENFLKQSASIEGLIKPAAGASARVIDPAQLQEKINLLQSPVPVRGEIAQGVEELPVEFAQILRYLAEINQRSATCTREQLPSLLKVQENAAWNLSGVSHVQVLSALQLFADRMNASLDESTVQYGFSLVEQDCRFHLLLTVTDSVNPQSSAVFAIRAGKWESAQDLIDAGAESLRVSQLMVDHPELDPLRVIAQLEADYKKQYQSPCAIRHAAPEGVTDAPYLSLSRLKTRDYLLFSPPTRSWKKFAAAPASCLQFDLDQDGNFYCLDGDRLVKASPKEAKANQWTLITEGVQGFGVNDPKEIILLQKSRVYRMDAASKQMTELCPQSPRIYGSLNKRYIHLSNSGELTAVSTDPTTYNPFIYRADKDVFENIGTTFSLENPVFGTRGGYYYISNQQLYWRPEGEWNLNRDQEYLPATAGVNDVVPMSDGSVFFLASNKYVYRYSGKTSHPWITQADGPPVTKIQVSADGRLFAVSGSQILTTSTAPARLAAKTLFATRSASNEEIRIDPGMVSIVEYRKGSYSRHQSAELPAIEGMTRAEGVLFRLFKEPLEGRIAVYSCQASSADFFLSFNDKCEGTTVIGLLGYSQAAAAPDLVPIQRCYNYSNFHRVTTGACPAGEKAEYILGYGMKGDAK